MLWVVKMLLKQGWLFISLKVMPWLSVKPTSRPRVVMPVANAARNYEILHERDDQDTERQDKRQRSGDWHQPTSQQSSHRSHGQNNDRHGSDRRG
nr:hypothetical protein [Tanacetum cinerariifolium]